MQISTRNEWCVRSSCTTARPDGIDPCDKGTAEENSLNAVQREWDTVARLEYLLHLGCLESRLNCCHTQLAVERRK